MLDLKYYKKFYKLIKLFFQMVSLIGIAIRGFEKNFQAPDLSLILKNSPSAQPKTDAVLN